MNAALNIRPIRPEDVPSTVALWREVFPGYGMSAEAAFRHTFGHPAFAPEGCLGAFAAEELVGFCLATDMLIAEGPLEPPPACIPALLVHPDRRQQGIGQTLLREAEAFAARRGHRTIRLGYPTYLQGTLLSLPGVNAAWSEAHWYFRHYGYRVTGSLDSARCRLEEWEIPAQEVAQIDRAASQGIEARPARPDDEPALLEFLQANFRSSWYRHVLRRSQAGRLAHQRVTVLCRDGSVLGFVGPADISDAGIAHMGVGIGVDAARRGEGLGNVLLFSFLDTLKRAGATECVIYGVGPKRYYDRAGFRMAELWLMMEKAL